MAIHKVKSGWQVDIQPGGRGSKRVRKTLPTKAKAEAFKKYAEGQNVVNEPWDAKPKDKRRLSDLIDLWYSQHGKHLKDGERRARKLKRLADNVGDPLACEFTAKQYLNFRNLQTVSAKTSNNELGYINAVFNELNRTEQIDYDNPLKKVRPIKIAERELSYLTLDQVGELLEAIEASTANPHVLLITRICLATGCRWGEAESLYLRHVSNQRITFSDTKSGKNRTVQIHKDLEKEIKAHAEEHVTKGKLFSGSITSFRRALARTSIELTPFIY